MMEIIKIKCLNCLEITSVLTKLIVPYEGKVVSIKCSNPQCGKPMKVQVPKITASNEPRLDANIEIPPTQIRMNQSSLASSARIKIIKNEKTEEQTFILKEGINTIGRLSMVKNEYVPDIQIFTSDKKISRNYHCAIILQRKGDYYEAILRDNRSINGTYLNNSDKALGPDDEVYLGNTDIFIVGETQVQIELE